MITREQLIKEFLNELSEEDIYIALYEFNELWYWCRIEALSYIIDKLNLSFKIDELLNYWAIAYQEWEAANWEYRINHLWDLDMEYNTIDKLLEELNYFEEQCIW